MRRILVALLLVAMFIPWIPVQAQSQVAFENVRVDLWPEYDRPDVLIIYRMQLTAGTALPAQVSLRIPRTAGAPYNVAMEDMDGSLYNLAYTSEVQGDWLVVTFSAPAANLQIEFYDPGLEKDGITRSYVYTWPGDYAVNNMLVAVQEPVNAENLKLLPDFGAGETSADNQTYYFKEVGQVNAGTSFTVNLSYDKPDETLTFSSQPVAPSQPLTDNTAGRTNLSGVLPWALGGIGLLLVVGGFVWYMVTRNPAPNHNKSGRKRHKPSPVASRQTTTVESGETSVFCQQCGKRARAGDLFCRSCGTRLRIE